RPPGVHRRKDRDRSSVYRSGRRRSRGAPRLRRGVQESAGQGSLEGLDQRSDPQMRTLIANGTCVTASDTFAADVWIENGKIAALVAPGTKLGQADRTIDAKGKYVIPGGIDAHTHLDMPFGGTNSIDDFAIQKKGGSLREALDTWHEKAEGRALVDYAFHMIATDVPPPVLDEMGAMVREGVTSFKLFMAYPGVLLLDDQSIFRAMLRAGDLGA